MSFIELTSPQGKPILVKHSAIECIYDQNDEHLHKMLTDIRLASGYSQFVKELPQYIKQEVAKANDPSIEQSAFVQRFYTPPESVIPTTRHVPPPTKRAPPRKRS